MLLILALVFAPVLWLLHMPREPRRPIRTRKHGNPMRAWRETNAYGDEREGWKGD